jgi:perosamine synthetase
VGFKYKMANLQAAIGCAQMDRIEELIPRKREIFNLYRESLEAVPSLKMNPELAGTVNGAWMPTVVFTPEIGITREKLQVAFAAENIDARVFFWPLSSLTMFAPLISNINAWSIPERSINLPSFHDISYDEQDRVVAVIQSLLETESKRGQQNGT